MGFFENKKVAKKPEIQENLKKLEEISHKVFYIAFKLEHVISIPMLEIKENSNSYFIKVTLPNRETKKSKVIENTYHPEFNLEIEEKMKLNPNSL